LRLDATERRSASRRDQDLDVSPAP
jgi:hypothetical protein